MTASGWYTDRPPTTTQASLWVGKDGQAIALTEPGERYLRRRDWLRAAGLTDPATGRPVNGLR